MSIEYFFFQKIPESIPHYTKYKIIKLTINEQKSIYKREHYKGFFFVSIESVVLFVFNQFCDDCTKKIS